MVNEWTRDDLPTLASVAPIAASVESYVYFASSMVLDAVVAHLNAHHPKPDDDDEGDTFPVRLRRQANTIAELQGVVNSWRRAHAIVEQERDQAREERDAAVRRAEDLRFSRDEARRAEGEWERERDQAVEACGLFQRDVHELRERAEAAEARTAPAVTREDVDEAIRTAYNQRGFGYTSVDIEVSTDAVCALFGVGAEPADPVEAKAREFAAIAFPDEPGMKPAWETATEETRTAFTRIAAHVLGQEGK